MAAALKDVNKIPLLTVVIANLAVFYAAVQTDAIFGGDWAGIAKGFAEALPAGLGLVIVGIINSQLSSEAKARIVFLRWNNPLPGSEAFTRHGASDPRVDLQEIARQYGPLPTDPPAQNKLWYKIYKSVESEPSVNQAHREFLFARDYACLSLMMFVVLGAIGMARIPSTKTTAIYLILLLVQFVLTSRAARNHGYGFVRNVLAVKAASKKALATKGGGSDHG